MEYKVVETSTVTGEELTRILNDNAGEGWIFDGFQFAMRDASHRPSMAFAVFRKPAPEAGKEGEKS